MTFLNPLMLLALAAAAVPVLLHLLNLRRTRRVEFSTLRFLREVQQHTMRRVQVRNWLLLALRVLAVACLVLAFARPAWRGAFAGAFGGHARTSVALVIDQSLSTAADDGRGSLLSQIQAHVARIVGQLDSGDEAFLVATGDLPERPERIVGQHNIEALTGEVRRLGPSARSASLSDAIRVAAERLGSSNNLNRELYVFTDLQATALDLGAKPSRLALPDGVKLFLLPVGGKPVDNLAVTAATVESRLLERGQPVVIRATVRNFGTAAASEVGASVYLDGERVAQSTVSVPAGGTTEVSFRAALRSGGRIAGEVRLDDDALPADNRRAFTLDVPTDRPLLVLNGPNATSGGTFLQVLADGTGGLFRPTVASADALGGVDLTAYAAVVLNGPARLSPGEITRLRDYLARGGGLILFPATGADLSGYNGLLSALGGGTLTGPVESDRALGFGRLDTGHPLFDGLFDGTIRAGAPPKLISPDVKRHLGYRPAGVGVAVLSLDDGAPLLVDLRPTGDAAAGRALVFTSALNLDWSAWPLRGSFPPLMVRSLLYASSSGSGGTSAVTLGQPVEQLIRTGDAGELTLRDPTGRESKPETRPVYGGTMVRFVPTRAGVYDLIQSGKIVRRVPVGLEPLESDLGRTTARSLRQTLIGRGLDPAQVVAAPAGAPLDDLLLQARYGLELWPYLIMLGLLLLLVESWLSRRLARAALVPELV